MNSTEEFLAKFRRAKKLTTLERMIEGEARKNWLCHDRSVSNYKITAGEYKKLGNKRAVAMYTAAHIRETELLEMEQSRFALGIA